MDICNPGESSTSVFFTDPADPDLTMAIVTKWYRYAQELETYLPASGFHLLPPLSKQLGRYPGQCRWEHLLTVTKSAIKRGTVAFTYDDQGNSATRVPSDDTAKRVRTVLEHHAPTRDILEIVFIALSPLVAGMAFLWMLYAVYRLLSCIWPIEDNRPEETELSNFPDDTYHSRFGGIYASYPPSTAETLPPYPESVKDRYSGFSYPSGKKLGNVTVQSWEVSSSDLSSASSSRR
jgi:hypothetical protein